MATRQVNTHEAKSRLSELIREAEHGHDVFIARNGQTVAKLIAWPPERAQRRPGAWAGMVHRATDDVGPDADVAAAFSESAESSAW
jgi:prevent-host-death family protein